MIRLLLVDDQEMIRIGLRGILGRHDPFEIVAEASDGLGAVEALASQPVDVVLMDIRMPGIDGVEATRRIRQRWSAEEVRVVMLTTFEQDSNVLAALRAGANAFLSKAAGPKELIAAIEEVAAGGGALSPAAAAMLIGRVKDEPATVVDADMTARFDALTPRERDVVLSMMTGLDVDAIAAERFLSPFTVKTHANRAMAKVGARDRAQLVAFAYRGGLTP
ncbi:MULTISPECIES: response regulator transcription factor [unclassified Frondihabitans]|uniref:response regulator transcription factor n=1 Tax=unclassified Frondihabitans TaxID=2626248 RepID=UPI00070094AA|nr:MULTISPECIES: response regulator transcription factor [unclassified Frondihabitans]KQQ26742.1 LuxR family transcriptional regulator [Frondihabitans sp. Leaf304]MBF4577696.1 response regulator transcription factor [Frondihabitans sp. VKM Ac-2883]